SVYRLDLYVDCGTVTDIDSNTYPTVQLGSQCWMAENLKTTRYANGISIPVGLTNTAVSQASRYYPNNQSTYVKTYGYLYNWRAVMGNAASSSSNPSNVQGVCPNGWHVPSDAEWTQLTNYVTTNKNFNYSSTASYIAKPLASQTGWNNYSNSGSFYPGDPMFPNNTTHFDAKPAGYNYGQGYSDYMYSAYYWTSTQYSTSSSYYRRLYYGSATVTSSYKAKYYGHSVRCVKGAGVLQACTDTLISTTVTTTYGTPYTWRGKVLTTTGIYYDSLQRVDGGCDSIYRLDLYVDCGTVTDIDGNTYPTVQLGSQCWMAENLKTTRYANGISIPVGLTNTAVSQASRYYPNNQSTYVKTYGYLYNWRAVMGNAASSSSNPSNVQGVCPNGWHVPSDAEWTQLTNYVTTNKNFNYSSTASYIAKPLASQTGWNNYSNSGSFYPGDPMFPNNTTHFDAKPAGYNYGQGYSDYMYSAYYWTSTQYSTSSSYYRRLYYGSATVTSSNKAKYYGHSVRCVKGAGVLQACTDTLISMAATITNGNSYTWRGKTFTQSGVYYDSLQKVDGGCDSVYRLDLTVTCGTVSDIDNNVYNTVQYGIQCWMAENLKTTRYADGTTINVGAATYLNVPSAYYPNGVSNYVNMYGYLYNWYAVMNGASSSSLYPSGVQGICPTGWHVPSDQEWTALNNYVVAHPNYNYSSTATYTAKPLASSFGWNNYSNSGYFYPGDNVFANNTTHFSAVPAGYSYGTSYSDYGYSAYFWSTTESSTAYATYRRISYSSDTVSISNNAKYYGYSVRCVKN
ncbi:MAG: fibrobacter succinogenes major paralogous domain-containing protein, partial [Bacteroidales bacterium]|nr:fibrobacter succinogenes major paralogous domain-containing protein [Bacteroidales bacterium]